MMVMTQVQDLSNIIKKMIYSSIFVHSLAYILQTIE